MRGSRCDKTLVGVAREIRHESNRRGILKDDPAAILTFRCENILKQNSSGAFEMFTAKAGFGFDQLEDKVCGVNLTMRMRIGHSNDFSPVFENENVIHLRSRSELKILVAQSRKKTLNI